MDEKFATKFLNLYGEFIKELDEYEKNPYRNRHNFWERDESFEAFIHWLKYKYIN